MSESEVMVAPEPMAQAEGSEATKWVFLRDELRDVLSVAMSVFPKGDTRKGVRLACTTNGAAEAVATDGEMGLVYRFRALSVSKAGCVVLPGKVFAELVKAATWEILMLEIRDGKAILYDGPARFELPFLVVADAPCISDEKSDEVGEVPTRELAEMIRETAFAAVTKKGRFAINGVLFSWHDDTVEMVATDSHRLAISTRLLSKPMAKKTARIIPLRTIELVRKICQRAKDGVSVFYSITENLIRWCIGDIIITSVFIEGRFPDYQSVLPKNCDKTLVVSRELFIRALEQAKRAAGGQGYFIMLKLSQENTALEARIESGKSAHIPILGEYKGEEIEIGFNPKYLLEMLRAIDEERVVFEMQDRTKPGMFRRGAEYLHIVMPYQVA